MYSCSMTVSYTHLTVAPKRLLDVATGTGDFAIQLHNHLRCTVKGIDLSNGMLEVARKKVADKGLQEQITFEQRCV